MVPPEPVRLYFEPSDPVTLIEESLVAVTVKVSEDPELMELDLAEIATVGFVVPEPTVIVVLAVALPLELVAVAV